MGPDPPVSLWPDLDGLGPLTDLYQITMMAGYSQTGHAGDRAVFEAFVRRLPKGRSYLVFAGLEQAVGDLLRLRFTREQAESIRLLPVFSHIDPSFFNLLPSLRFEGDVWAVREGTVVFAGEPLLRVDAALAQAQWVETFLLTSLGYPTLVASKAARILGAAQGRPVYDFGLRRGHGAHAGMLAARAAYIAGCAGTSNVEAAIRLGIPCTGTMAHSWVQVFENEPEAFAAFAGAFPGVVTLLVDTYDTPAGVRHAAAIEPPIQAVRIDSGDLRLLARETRATLDALGRGSVQILASGDLDEFSIAALVKDGAPFDAFGVGTEMVTSRDAPALSFVYKLVELNGQGRVKLSPGKRSYPLAKQIFRRRSGLGHFSEDLVTRADEVKEGEPLLVPVIRGGKLVSTLPSIQRVRDHCRAQLAALPDSLRRLDSPADYLVTYSLALEDEARKLGLGN